MVSGDFLSAWPDPLSDADIEVIFSHSPLIAARLLGAATLILRAALA